MDLFAMDIEEVEKNFEAVVSEVYHSGCEVLITRKSKPLAMIVPLEENEDKQ